jgi:hypothetical protein
MFLYRQQSPGKYPPTLPMFCIYEYIQILSLTDSTDKQAIEFTGDNVIVLADIGQKRLARKNSSREEGGLSPGVVTVFIHGTSFRTLSETDI